MNARELPEWAVLCPDGKVFRTYPTERRAAECAVAVDHGTRFPFHGFVCPGFHEVEPLSAGRPVAYTEKGERR